MTDGAGESEDQGRYGWLIRGAGARRFMNRLAKTGELKSASKKVRRREGKARVTEEG